MKKRQARNGFERALLSQIKRTKLKVEYETEKIPYVLAGHYIPDFIIHTSLGKIYIEAKGYFRPEAKRKMLAVKRQHPELDIRIIFYRASRNNERWAMKNGFKFAFEKIPKEWLV